MSIMMNRNKEPPPAKLKRIVRKVEYEYIFLKTVHSLEELDDFRFQHGCNFGSAKMNRFTEMTLLCSKRSKLHGMCPFSLMVRRAFRESGEDIHVYAYSEHNHPVKPEAERAAHRVPRNALVPDADSPASFTAKDSRQWTFLGTANNEDGMHKFRLKHHCGAHQRRNYEYKRISLKCNIGKCQFRLLALKTDRCRYHMYAHGRHTCCHADGKREAAANTKAVKKARIEQEESEEFQDEEEEFQDEEEEHMDIEELSGEMEEEARQWTIEEIKHQLTSALREGNTGKVDKWMIRTGQQQIGALLQTLDRSEMIKLLQMAERESREGRSKENLSSSADWLDWIREVLREVLLLLSLTQHSELNKVHNNFVDILLC